MAAADGERMNDRAAAPTGASGTVAAPGCQVLTREHVLDAIARSSDEGCTLDFSNKNLVDVGDAGVDELVELGRSDDVLDECRVLRIALVNNALSSIPMSFARLSRLRYLTFRANSFSVFPEVLTTMPSLEILDFSKNKIRGLPTNPGTLINLRVLSISRNRITKLPTYLSDFRNLTVLKAYHNPYEWPPKVIMEPEEDMEDPEAMRRWLDSVRTWMVKNPYDEQKRLPQRPGEADSESREDTIVPQRARTLSADSQSSAYSASSYTDSVDDQNRSISAIDTKSLLQTVSDGLYASPDSYLPPRDDSLPPVNGDHIAKPNYNAHSRNMSSVTSSERRNGERKLAVQKSLPDLRLEKGKTATATNHKMHAPAPENHRKPSIESLPSAVESSASATETPIRGRPPRSYRMNHEPLPSISERKAPSMDVERNSYFKRLSTLPSSTLSRAIPKALLSVVDSIRSILFAVSQIYQSLQHYTVYAIDERVSSVLLKILGPASSLMMKLINALDKFDTFSKRGCPPPGVSKAVIEACRENVSIFGKAIKVLKLQLQTITSCDDIRYSRQMLLVLYGATAEIAHSWQGIVQQLDHIEPMLSDERHSPLASPGLATPTPTKPLPRKMVMTPHTPLNRTMIPPIAEQPEPLPPQPVFSRPSTAPGTGAPPPPPLLRSHSAQPGTSTGSVVPVAPALARPIQSEGRSRTSRRHAGSFSAKDLEIGRSLPANTETSPPARGIASGSSTPTPRAHHIPLRRSPPPPLPTMFMSTPSPQPVQPLPGTHSRQNSGQNGIPTITPLLAQPGPSRLAVDAPTSSMDTQALNAMANAVRAAPTVWSMLEETASEMSEATDSRLREGLPRAQDVTRRLAGSIKAVQDGQSGVDRKALREDAHNFAKMVITLSKMVKEHGSAHKLSAQLRADIAKLTNATQEYVMLLHVSSFATSASRPHSPLQLLANGSSTNIATPLPPPPPISASTNSQPSSASSIQAPPSSGGLAPVDERTQEGGGGGGSGAGLSRSRSAQPSASTKVVPNGMAGTTPRSALPHQQAFKIPAPPGSSGGLRPGGSRLRNDSGGLLTPEPQHLHA